MSRRCGDAANLKALSTTATEAASISLSAIPNGWQRPACSRQAGFNASVGSVGDSYDNALAETINGLYKAEGIHQNGPWKGLDDVERATLTWVEWFNNQRLLRPIGDVPPAEYEMLYYQTESSEAA